ncbi:hypothetical protein BOX15_Mlig016356g3, partial [Macrostomum lignano]
TSSESMIRNSVAIVTGGGRGIGRAIAESLLVRQARRVIVADLNEATGGQAVQELNETHGSGRCHFVRCSVTDRAELRRVFQKAIELDGRVDIVANNAGVANEADPDLTIDVNVKGVIYGSQMAVEFMSKQSGGHGGVVINTASAAGLFTSAYVPAYTASKHAVVGWTGSMGSEPHLSTHGVRFNCLCPAFILTDMATDCFKLGDKSMLMPDELKKKVTKNQVLIPMSVLTDQFIRLIEDPQQFNGYAVSILPPDQVRYIDKSMKALM